MFLKDLAYYKHNACDNLQYVRVRVKKVTLALEG